MNSPPVNQPLEKPFNPFDIVDVGETDEDDELEGEWDYYDPIFYDTEDDELESGDKVW